MPRPRTKSRTKLVDSALNEFWKNGYHVVSMADLVRETGVSRGGIYSDFAGKEELFHACLERYQEVVVTPFFEPVETKGAGLAAIGEYFENLLSAVGQSEDLCRGCLVVNTLAQLEAGETKTRQLLEQHLMRMTVGFRKALTNENKNRNKPLKKNQIDELAEFITISIQGLSSYFRSAKDVRSLRKHVATLMSLLESRF